MTEKILGPTSAKIRLAGAAVLILGVGAGMAPRSAQTPLSKPPQERAAPLIEEQVLTRPTPAPFRAVRDVASGLLPFTVAIVAVPDQLPATRGDTRAEGMAPSSGRYGVQVSNVHVLSHVAALDGRQTVSIRGAAGDTRSARLAAFDSASGLALLESEPVTASLPGLSATIPPAGAMAVGVARSERGDTVIPVFVTSAHDGVLTIDRMRDLPPGMPVFSLDGLLLAVAGTTGSAAMVERVLPQLQGRTPASERPAAAGISLQAIEPALAAVVGGDGVLVADTVNGGPAQLAGLRPGDVLAAIGAQPVSSVEMAISTLGTTAAGAPVSLRIRRRGRPATLQMTPLTPFEVATLALRQTDPPDGPLADAVLPPEQLERLRIPFDARILSIDGVAVASPEAAGRALRGARGPALVQLHRQGRSVLTVVPGSR